MAILVYKNRTNCLQRESCVFEQKQTGETRLKMVAALPGLLRFSPEVKKALELGGKRSRLVLLESAVLTHGMPHPQNINLARKLEEIVRGRVRSRATRVDGGTVT